MRNKIEDLNLIYGVSIFNIMDKYAEFKTSSTKRIEVLSNKLNDFYSWLNELENVSSINAVKVGSLILEDDKIRNYLISKDYSVKEFHNIIRNKMSDIDIKNLDKEIIENKENFYIEFTKQNITSRKNRCDSVEFLKNNIYSHNLLYVDLIMLLLNNYNFSRKLEKMSPDNWSICFLNTLNIIFYEFDKVINTNRDDLYYSVLYFLEYNRVNSLLFPSMLNNEFHFNSVKANIKRFLCDFIFKGFHNINRSYYIEIPEYSYDNSKKQFPSHNYDTQSRFLNNIFNQFDFRQKLFIFRYATYDSSDFKNNTDIKELEEFINSIKDNPSFIIKSQSTADESKKLIEDSFTFVKDYCKEKDLNVIDCIFNPDFEKKSYHNFITLVIRYNEFDYKFVLSKFNLSYTWKLYLRDEKIYRMNAYLYDDFKHLVEAMFHD